MTQSTTAKTSDGLFVAWSSGHGWSLWHVIRGGTMTWCGARVRPDVRIRTSAEVHRPVCQTCLKAVMRRVQSTGAWSPKEEPDAQPPAA